MPTRTFPLAMRRSSYAMPTVAQRLSVGNILEGSVRKSGRRVCVTAQLIEVATNSTLWSNSCDRELDDIFAVQDDIAQSVVTELRAARTYESWRDWTLPVTPKCEH